MPEWPFDQPTSCAVITVREIAFENAPILHVTHDLDDHGWQFLTLADAKVEDGVVLCFADVVAKDSTLYELADLPPGWHAWRESTAHPWRREPNPHDDESD